MDELNSKYPIERRDTDNVVDTSELSRRLDGEINQLITSLSTKEMTGEVAEGSRVLLQRGAIEGATLVYMVHRENTEVFIVFDDQSSLAMLQKNVEGGYVISEVAADDFGVGIRSWRKAP